MKFSFPPRKCSLSFCTSNCSKKNGKGINQAIVRKIYGWRILLRPSRISERVDGFLPIAFRKKRWNTRRSSRKGEREIRGGKSRLMSQLAEMEQGANCATANAAGERLWATVGGLNLERLSNPHALTAQLVYTNLLTTPEPQ